MKIEEIKSLSIPDVKVIKFARFKDNRGYFTEPFRQSDLEGKIFLKGERIFQTNESFSSNGVLRGLHFQWNPFMGKLVRTLRGRMVDIFLDVRVGSPTFGCGMMYSMKADTDSEFSEWIWVPPGFAHGNFFTEDTLIEYYCTGEYSPGCEAGIFPLSQDIDWRLCDEELKKEFDELVREKMIVSEKDKMGLSVTDWKNDERSKNFIYDNLK